MTPVEVESQTRRLRDLPRLVQTAEGFPEILAALAAGHGATVDGAWGSSCALVAAALVERVPRTLVVVTSHIPDVDDLRDDIATFAGRPVLTFPAWESLPREQNVADETYGQRLRVLKSLAADPPPGLVVTSVQALLQPVPSADSIAKHSRLLRVGETIVLDELLRWLVERGFVRRDTVELPGEIGLRGGILDIFPPDLAQPARIELFGDEIESIRSFDIESQRSVEQFQSLSLTAARPAAAAEPQPDGDVRRDESASPTERRDGGTRGLVPPYKLRPRRTEVAAEDLSPFPQREGAHLCSYLQPGSWFMLVEPRDLTEQGRHYLNRLNDPRGCFSVEGSFQQMLQFPSIYASTIADASLEATCHLRIESIDRFSGELAKVKRELDDAARLDEVLVACHNQAEAKRLAEVFADSEVARSGRLHFDIGHVRAGFRLVAGEGSGFEASESRRAGVQGSGVQDQTSDDSSLTTHHSPFTSLVVISDHELFQRTQVQRPRPRRHYESRAIDSFLDLDEGDLVVHLTHGIGIYRGMEMLEKRGHVEEQLVLEFADRTRLYVPSSKIELVQKYVGGAKSAPALSKIGSSSWERRKDRVAQAVLDMASDLIDLQAARESQPGITYPEDSAWQADFEAAFSYEETDDQLRAMVDIKTDMARTRPTDRLICGDVGYGKTELAMRAAFKAVDFGKQVAVLVPTTVLAEQHYRTFSQRMAEFPFEIEVLSRFKTKGEQRAVLQRLAAGQIDIIIGTHRLVQNDVLFSDLGLVVIDEEQRFGVEHKEKLKTLRRTVDVLTLTATPIPRTLHMSLLGIRDISNLETAPHDRLAIETRITRFDPTLVRNAILRELNRDGQVYFVHNRVHSIQAMANRLQEIVPDASILIGHGQMGEHELEKAMFDFVEHRADILVATTIIESGLDIPNVNTIFINEADRYGLADLHQLRGRVGRYKHRAYAYLLLDPQRRVTTDASKRLKAIEEYTELGAGFKIAMRDLEIRGAGNILGAEQSGHIASVGYELYCQMLDKAVGTLKKQPIKSWLDVTIELPLRNYLPRDYVPGLRQRIEVYRKLARLHDMEDVRDFRRELEDRFGAPPDPVANLLHLAELRILAERWQIELIRLDGDFAMFGYRNPESIKRLARQSRGRLRVADATSAYLPLDENDRELAELLPQIKALLQQK